MVKDVLKMHKKIKRKIDETKNIPTTQLIHPAPESKNDTQNSQLPNSQFNIDSIGDVDESDPKVYAVLSKSLFHSNTYLNTQQHHGKPINISKLLHV